MLIKIFTCLLIVCCSELLPNDPLGTAVQSSAVIPMSQCKNYSFIIPPAHWQLAEPAKEKPHVIIAFFDPLAKGFKPSINIAVENANISLADYIKAVKALHQKNPNKKWRKLGKIQTAAGEAILTQIDMQSEWGPICMMQAILVDSGKAYVINTAALKANISTYYPIFNNAIQSFSLTNSLMASIKQEGKRLLTTQFIARLEEEVKAQRIRSSTAVKDLEKHLAKEHEDLGIYWQGLVVKEFLLKSDDLERPLHRQNT